MKPCLNPKLSITTLTTGTRQLVVQEAFEMMWCLAGSYFSLFTPMQIVMSSPLAGAEITTFLAPAARCLDALSLSVKRPVLSSTNRSEEHTSELQSQSNLVCRLLLEKKKKTITRTSLHRLRSHHV